MAYVSVQVLHRSGEAAAIHRTALYTYRYRSVGERTLAATAEARDSVGLFVLRNLAEAGLLSRLVVFEQHARQARDSQETDGQANQQTTRLT